MESYLIARAQEAVEDYFKDLGFAFWNTIEIRQVRPVEDILKAIVENRFKKENEA